MLAACRVQVVDTGVNYACGFKAEENVATLHADDNTRGNGRGRLDLGVVTNKGQPAPPRPALPPGGRGGGRGEGGQAQRSAIWGKGGGDGVVMGWWW